ncbi:MAG: cytochrome c oxidase subunit II, partial [Novosphingobium sp.]|nr:cytochrome c oxidase subunit II [Novosphingobium sp.]
MEGESKKTMIFGKHARAATLAIKAFCLSLALIMVPQAVLAAAPAAAASVEEVSADAAPDAQAAEGAYVRMAPTEGKGMPEPGAIGLQEQYSPLGDYAHWIHNAVLLPIIAVICLFVLFLLLFVIVRYNRRANPAASRTSHNTLIEI